MNLNKKFQDLEDELSNFFKERDELIHGTIIAILSKKHVFAVGPPGTAKSMIIRKISDTIQDANYWEWLFTKFTIPKEVFGPVKLSKLKEDKFERKLKNKLPNANFAFIDEIFKANSSILNSLLTILNERIYHNGENPLDVPLETVMSASNEIPENRDELGALWDRFLIKHRVKPIQNNQKFRNMLKEDDPDVINEEELIEEKANEEIDITTTFTLDEIHRAQEEVQKVKITDDVLDNIVEIRNVLRKEGIIPSDRRFKEAIDAIKAEAWLHGKDTITPDDLRILSHILWDEIDQISIVREQIMETTNPLMRKANELIDGVRDAWKKAQKAEDSEQYSVASEAVDKINKAVEGTNEMLGLEDIKTKLETQNRDTKRIEKYIEEAKDIKKNKISKGIMGL